MFIELVEYLRCPQDHPETHCVLATSAMNGRDVVRGLVGCPNCHREYPVEQGIVYFGASPVTAPPSPDPDPAAVHALLGLTSPGGNVVLVGSATRLARDLVERLDGVHVVGINADADEHSGSGVSLLQHPSAIPLRTAMARGVVLGAECTDIGWKAEAARVLLPGLRLVTFDEQFEVGGIERMTAGKGMWVGAKRSSVVHG